jgi:hypothetical protein
LLQTQDSFFLLSFLFLEDSTNWVIFVFSSLSFFR